MNIKTSIVGFCLLLLVACGSTPNASLNLNENPTEATNGARSINIFYATNRAENSRAGEFFNGERGDMSYGQAEVGIPPNHQIGSNNRPSLFRFEWSENERKHIALRGLQPLGHAGFIEQINTALNTSADRRVMLFVHGYNVSFAQAVRNLAQFATDLKFDGPIILFSWPSQATLTGYTKDDTNVEWSQPHLAQVMEELLEQTPAEKIYLFGHSMGSRVLTRSINKVSRDLPLEVAEKMREMILVAPDIDADIFRLDIAPSLVRTGTHVTLYASSSDRALMASKAFHGYVRAGDSGPGLVATPGVETIDASGSEGGFLGHSYFAEDRRIMEDIYAILQTGQRADGRFGLQSIDTPEGRVWNFRR